MTVDNVITAEGERMVGICGGNALYSAAGMRVWDDRVGIVGKVGEDYPADCLNALAAFGVDVAGLRLLPGPHALRVAFAYRPDGSRTRTVPVGLLAKVPAAERHHFRDTTFDDNVYLSFSPEVDDIPAGWISNACGTHLPALRFATHRTLTQHVREVNPRGVLTIDSPWYEGSDVPGDDLEVVMARASAVMPSEQDLAIVWPGLAPLDGARAMRARGARIAVVKLGSAGCIVVDQSGRAAQIPAFPARAVELTGAGDAFCGGFLAGLAKTGDPIRAACYGTVSASFVVETKSALDAMAHLNQAEAESRLDHLTGEVTILGGGGT